MKITLSDGSLTNVYSFTIDVLNRAPAYTDATFTGYAAVTVHLNSAPDVLIPSFVDPEGSAVTVTITEPSPGALTSVSFTLAADNSKFTLAPTSFGQVGVHTLAIMLSDSFPKSISHTLSVTVVNDAPVFTTVLQALKFPLNSIFMHSITDISDTEGHTITMTLVELSSAGASLGLPYFYTKTGAYSMKFAPIKFTDVGFHTFGVTITDGQKSSASSFQVEITNSAPFFPKEVPADLNMKLNNTVYYKLPVWEDDETNPTIVIVEPPEVLDFIKIDNDTLVIYPNKWTYLKLYNIDVILTDTNKNSTPYPFKLKITNSAPQFDSQKPKNFKMLINEE